jgi:hypothetical protein
VNGLFEILMEFLSWKSYLPEAVYQGHLFRAKEPVFGELRNSSLYYAGPEK